MHRDGRKPRAGQFDCDGRKPRAGQFDCGDRKPRAKKGKEKDCLAVWLDSPAFLDTAILALNWSVYRASACTGTTVDAFVSIDNICAVAF